MKKIISTFCFLLLSAAPSLAFDVDEMLIIDSAKTSTTFPIGINPQEDPLIPASTKSLIAEVQTLLVEIGVPSTDEKLTILRDALQAIKDSQP